ILFYHLQEHIMNAFSRDKDPLKIIFFMKNNEYVGFCTYVTYLSEDGKCLIVDYCIDAKYRNQNLGRQFFYLLKDQVIKEGGKYFALNLSNEDNQRFWQSLGFEKAYIDEYGEDVYICKINKYHLEISNKKVILRDFIESDIEDRIYWETVEREWQLWDAPWEKEEFNPDEYRQRMLKQLSQEKDVDRMRWGFQICINDASRKHIGWCNAYRIDDNFKYTQDDGHCTIGINIPDLSSRRKGYATAAWDLFIQYLFSKGIKDIYTQTWSGNIRVLGLMDKIEFEECNREINFRTVRGKLYDGLTLKLNKEKYYKFHEEFIKFIEG
ncbi:GNAT family N-acetyltransferase, partial [Tepidimicrobium xylanilyticum]